MAWYRDKKSAPQTHYHIYNRGNHKERTFLEVSDYRFFLMRLFQGSVEQKFQIVAYCLLPNHFHLLVFQEGSEGPSALIQPFLTSYVKVFNDRHNKVGRLFQDRFKQKIIHSTESFLQLSRYIHRNPIGMAVEDPINNRYRKYGEDNFMSYPWSSMNAYRGEKTYQVHTKPILDLFEESDNSVKAYIAFVQNKLGAERGFGSIRNIVIED